MLSDQHVCCRVGLCVMPARSVDMPFLVRWSWYRACLLSAHTNGARPVALAPGACFAFWLRWIKGRMAGGTSVRGCVDPLGSVGGCCIDPQGWLFLMLCRADCPVSWAPCLGGCLAGTGGVPHSSRRRALLSGALPCLRAAAWVAPPLEVIKYRLWVCLCKVRMCAVVGASHQLGTGCERLASAPTLLGAGQHCSACCPLIFAWAVGLCAWLCLIWRARGWVHLPFTGAVWPPRPAQQLLSLDSALFCHCVAFPLPSCGVGFGLQGSSITRCTLSPSSPLVGGQHAVHSPATPLPTYCSCRRRRSWSGWQLHV